MIEVVGKDSVGWVVGISVCSSVGGRLGIRVTKKGIGGDRRVMRNLYDNFCSVLFDLLHTGKDCTCKKVCLSYKLVIVLGVWFFGSLI